jgi:hypothetical protein
MGLLGVDPSPVGGLGGRMSTLVTRHYEHVAFYTHQLALLCCDGDLATPVYSLETNVLGRELKVSPCSQSNMGMVQNGGAGRKLKTRMKPRRYSTGYPSFAPW